MTLAADERLENRRMMMTRRRTKPMPFIKCELDFIEVAISSLRAAVTAFHQDIAVEAARHVRIATIDLYANNILARITASHADY